MKSAEHHRVIRYDLREWLEALRKSCDPRWEEIRPKLWKMIQEWSAWQALHIEPRSLFGSSVVEWLAGHKITIPIMVLIGENDAQGSHRSSEKLLEIIPNAKKVTLKEACQCSISPAIDTKAVPKKGANQTSGNGELMTRLPAAMDARLHVRVKELSR